MSPSSTQQWTRRIRYADQHIRVSDADRNAVAEQLGAHYADGRLDQAEFDERISRTMAAKTRGDLTGLFDDLPDPGPAAAPGPGGPGGPGGPQAPYVRPRRRSGAFRSLILLAIVIVLCSTAWHAMNSFFFFNIPWFPIAVIVAIVLFAGRRRHHR
jgi:Domain of unknown function (DUF1707)